MINKKMLMSSAMVIALGLSALQANANPAAALLALQETVLSKGPNGEAPAAASSIFLNDDEIAKIKELCGNQARLKVILETGEIGTLDDVRRASDIAIYAGADFIKTSTGKIGSAASIPVTLTMLYAIKDYYLKTGTMIGMKPAGGISTSKLAIHYLVMVKEILGNAWLSNKWFRFGASSLANDVLLQLEKQRTGVYQSKDYISID